MILKNRILINRPWLFLLTVFILSVGWNTSQVFSQNSDPFQKIRSAPSLEKEQLFSKAYGLITIEQARKVVQRMESQQIALLSPLPSEPQVPLPKKLGIAVPPQVVLENKKIQPSTLEMVHIAKIDEPLDNVLKKYVQLGAKKDKILALNSMAEITFLKDGELYLEEGSFLLIPKIIRPLPFLARPVQWSRISSGFGLRRHPISHRLRRHRGYDLVAPYGAPVYAGREGIITFEGWMGDYGNMVEIKHAKITTRYGHLSKIYVQSGQKVKRRQLIGRVGSTGLSTGPHLHFEVRRNSDGKPIRPGSYLF